MPEFDHRNTVEHLYTGGSDIGLQVELDADQAAKYFPDTPTAGFHTIGTFEGGTIAYRVDGAEDLDEAGQQTGKFIKNSPSFFELSNTLKETSDNIEDLIDELLTQKLMKYRYALPAGTIVTDAGPPEVTGPAHKVYGVQNGKVQPGWELATTANTKRVRGFLMRATKKGTVPAFVRKTVDVTNEASWPTELDPFKAGA
ncbi:MAG: hypothetical protein AAGI52_06650 [Bacteroidota bacterium]